VSSNKITFDPTADAGYIYLTNEKILESDEVAPGIILDYDENDNIVGIEVLDIHNQKDSDIEKLPPTIQQHIHNLIAHVLQNETV
jgi:uncharacterized protein YuzE